MKIKVISVGKIKEKYLKDGILEYTKRLSKFASFEEIELKDEVIYDNIDINQIKKAEGQKILNALKDKEYIIALDIKGVMLSSEELALKFRQIENYHSSNIAIIIGGSLGLCNEVLKKADLKLSFSKMTFPHQLMKLILLEQLYRLFKINNNETYHK